MNYELATKVHTILGDVAAEVLCAKEKFPRPQNSPHEAWAVLYEEVDELWDLVRGPRAGAEGEAARKEAIQIAAMAVRYALEVCGG